MNKLQGHHTTIGTTASIADQTNSRKHLADWLRDAYAMEHQAIEMLEKQADRIEHYQELKTKVLHHLQETRRQAERLEECLKILGEDTSMLKTGLGKLIGTAQAWSGIFMSDEIVKGSVALYVFKHYEIGNYQILIETANETDMLPIARLCEESLREEEVMAIWMASYLPKVTRQFLHSDAAGKNAKR